MRRAQKPIVQRKYWFKKHWKTHGGLKDENAPRGLPYKGVSEEDWNFLCDFFESEDQMKLMDKNVSNRSNRPLEGAHISKTILQHFHEKADPLTGELPSAVDNFEEFYCKNGKWKNDYAENAHNMMLAMRNVHPQQPMDGSEESVRVPKDIHITSEVLGKQSRYIKGVGPLPKLCVVGGSRATGISSKSSNEEVSELRQTVDQLHNELEEQQQ